HIGNARPFVLGMWLRNWLRHRGYDATLVHNITDVNDKIYDAARAAGVPSEELAREMTARYEHDTDGLGLGRPDAEPLATETVPQIVALIEELVGRGLAYEAGGDVYFRVVSYPRYGELSGRVDGEGTRNPSEEAEEGEVKEDPRDFALWKAHKEGEDTSWDSPWGRGRPGWHIECSAMAEDLLGPVFEIHGGGLDLIFPHHENELAQSRALGHEFAQIWMHNGMLRFTGEKMSKSLGNVVTIREALDEWGRETVLLFFMTAHWSKPIDFSDETMAQAKAQVETLRNKLRLPSQPGGDWVELAAALDDDFNTPDALAVLHRWRDRELLVRGLDLFGLGSLAEAAEAPPEVEELARQRQAARAAGDYAESDRLRAEVEALGWEVRDGAAGFELVPR
ncbi:MAG TPA: cysteine--tRNA ligase, partial [Gaiellaceae bacterium]|nr:cysteine--tRNA ligase [Gaiellaceae bacterium]